MSDPTTMPGVDTAPPKPVAPPPAPKAPDIKERASGLLSVMTDAQKHNAPITPWMLTELAAVVGQVTGQKAAAPQHLILDGRGLPDDTVFRKADGTVAMVTSAEEALAYVRSLPGDVQARPHWVAADNALVEAVASVPGSDVSPAIRLFDAALAEDRKLDAKPVEIKDKPADDAKVRGPDLSTPLPDKPEDDAKKAATEAQLRANAATPPGTPAPVPV